ncbi:sulfurtransferase TusA family protein [Lacrimispora algidixylanolytica]|jgi:tRNA 2-thiouridine synthesizing protein A|uniref:Response regulator SirA n=1 Tax=Lacrimispora algidixylanolytica TaxID=94868 RepID=A0A419SY61_9FIRM|nr:sulfurtransferase TusA family protein [Lacrimispora algidixylanolytica]RKD30136.1 response regulator SirA [Lacrimispora algidixylanolytica]
MKKIDCLGEICPVPVMKLKSVMKSIQSGEDYLLITDHSCTIKNLESFCKANHLKYCSDEVMNGVWEITVTASK